MHLKDLFDHFSSPSASSVPDWMIGCFRRHCITFANGMSDTQTRVFWLQGRNLTIDLRLPPVQQQVPLAFKQCQQEELLQLANYEGWSAHSIWRNNQLSWTDAASFQLHNRWPEPAILQRVGNCMMEFAPSGAYVEDWRFQPNRPGPLVSLRLLEERDLGSGELRHKDGALIIAGNWAGLVLGRANASIHMEKGQQLRDLVKACSHDSAQLNELFNFETSLAHGSVNEGFTIEHSTCFQRMGEVLCPLDGFELDASNKQVIQTLTTGSASIQRRFVIDTMEADFTFENTSSWTHEAEQWFTQEAPTLTPYLKKIN